MKPTRIGLVAIVLSLVFGVSFIIVSHNFATELSSTRDVVARNKADETAARQAQAVKDTASARTASCEQYNDQQTHVKAGDKLEIRAVIIALAPEPRTPKVALAVATFLPKYDGIVDATHPLRDCSPAGIAKYLRSPTP